MNLKKLQNWLFYSGVFFLFAVTTSIFTADIISNLVYGIRFTLWGRGVIRLTSISLIFGLGQITLAFVVSNIRLEQSLKEGGE